jgi:hypothetical protein
MFSRSSGWFPVVCCCEHDNEPLEFCKRRDIFWLASQGVNCSVVLLCFEGSNCHSTLNVFNLFACTYAVREFTFTVSIAFRCYFCQFLSDEHIMGPFVSVCLLRFSQQWDRSSYCWTPLLRSSGISDHISARAFVHLLCCTHLFSLLTVFCFTFVCFCISSLQWLYVIDSCLLWSSVINKVLLLLFSLLLSPQWSYYYHYYLT